MDTVRLEKRTGLHYLSTATFQIRGAETEELLAESFHQFEEVLDEIDVNASETEFKQVTSAFVRDLGREVNLEALAIPLGLEHTEYEPKQFPGLIYRPPSYEVTLLISLLGRSLSAVRLTLSTLNPQFSITKKRSRSSIQPDCDEAVSKS